MHAEKNNVDHNPQDLATMEKKEKTTIIIDCNNHIMIVSLHLEPTNVLKPSSFIKTPSTLPLPTIESF